MLIEIAIHQIPVRIHLDWTSRTWSLVKDKFNLWHVGVSAIDSGKFLLKKWGVLWLQDSTPSTEPLIILWDSPSGSHDAASRRGTARVHLPSAPFRDEQFPWQLQQQIAAPPKPLSALRAFIATRLEEDFRIEVIPPSREQMKKLRAGKKDEAKLSANQQKYVKLFGYNDAPTSGTNCYIMGALLAAYAGRHKGVRKLDDYIQSNSLSATTGLPDRARRRNAWVTADGSKMPQPGDFFALTTEKKKNWSKRYEDMSITHVGALVKRTGNKWRTADMGQVSNPGGHGLLQNRKYYPNGTLGSPKAAYDARWLLGWVDLDKYFG